MFLLVSPKITIFAKKWNDIAVDPVIFFNANFANYKDCAN